MSPQPAQVRQPISMEALDAAEPVLDPVERVSETCFGLIMALTFVGSIVAAEGEDASPHTIFVAALGCNLAWGLVDGVMYLVHTLARRGARHALARAVHADPGPAALPLLRAALPAGLSPAVGDDALAAIAARMAASPDVVRRPVLRGKDWLASLLILAVVTVATFPVVLPFVLFQDLQLGLLVSRVLTLAMLLAGGAVIGRQSGFGAWRAGFLMVAVGVALTAIVVALGG
ncbi:MAG: hypothetical protein QM767_10280 [Anaeromyxobacter sp.]